MAAVLNPGASASFTEPMQKNTQYVAAIALYRAPGTDGAWKRVIGKKKLDPKKPLKLELVANQLRIAGDDGGQTAKE
ncbi:type VI secretion lipoprotein TssJ [Paraburkholderia sacchari]